MNGVGKATRCFTADHDVSRGETGKLIESGEICKRQQQHIEWPAMVSANTISNPANKFRQCHFFFYQMALPQSLSLFDFVSLSLSLSLDGLIHIYSSHSIVRKVTSLLEDLWRHVRPPSLPPFLHVFFSCCFSPIHVFACCKIIIKKKAVFLGSQY